MVARQSFAQNATGDLGGTLLSDCQHLRLSWAALRTSLASRAYVIVERSLASGLDEGSLASLNYAFKVSNLPVTVLAGAVCTVIFPRLSELHGGGDTEGTSDALAG